MNECLILYAIAGLRD